MSLENINCPQFVDFTSVDTFDIHDGADFFFEKRIVGELDLGFGNMNINNQNESDFSNIFSNSTNTQPNENERHKTMVIKKPIQTTPLSENQTPKVNTPKLEYNKESVQIVIKQQQQQQQIQNKENTILASNTTSIITTGTVKNLEQVNDYQAIVGTVTNVSSAIELVSSTVLNNNNKKELTKQVSLNDSANNKQKVQHSKPQTPMSVRQRSSSNVSTSSTGSNKQVTLAPHQQAVVNRLAVPVQAKVKQTQSNTNSQNIVKKTLAKMTAAFKQTKQLSLDVQQKSTSSSNNNPNAFDAFNLKTRLLSSKKSKLTSGSSNQPVKVEYNNLRNLNEPLSPTNQTSSNRRCSSVPRTLKEKQALQKVGIINDENNDLNEDVEQQPNNMNENGAKNNNNGFIPNQTTTLGEKIQNFFNSHSSGSSSSATNHGLLNKHSSKANKLTDNKNKSNVSTSVVSKNLNQLVKTDSQDSQDRRRSKSCDTKINNTETTNENHHSESKLVGHNSRRSRNSTSDTVDVKTKPVPSKVAMSPGYAQLNKTRQRSADRGPVMPLYKGVKFIPKLGQKYQPNSIESDRIEDLLKHRPAMLSKIQPITVNTKPLLDFQKKIPAGGLIRATPGKSASFKQIQHNSSAMNSDSTIQKSTQLNRTATGNSASNDTTYNMSRDMDMTKDCHTSYLKTFNESTTSSSKVNSTSNLSSFNTSNTRKKSETKPCGLLHTELRALRRNEFDQSLKEKERMAILLRRELEEEKMKKQQEEIQKIRAQRNFRSRPIKHYKPIEVKPSEKPLTEPRSPQLGVSFKNVSDIKTTSTSSLQLSSSLTANALVDAPISVNVSNIKQNGLAVSQDDVRFNY